MNNVIAVQPSNGPITAKEVEHSFWVKLQTFQDRIYYLTLGVNQISGEFLTPMTGTEIGIKANYTQGFVGDTQDMVDLLGQQLDTLYSLVDRINYVTGTGNYAPQEEDPSLMAKAIR